jgi:hypothetical protein
MGIGFDEGYRGVSLEPWAAQFRKSLTMRGRPAASPRDTR